MGSGSLCGIIFEPPRTIATCKGIILNLLKTGKFTAICLMRVLFFKSYSESIHYITNLEI